MSSNKPLEEPRTETPEKKSQAAVAACSQGEHGTSVVLIGVGQTARALVNKLQHKKMCDKAFHPTTVVGTTRSAERQEELVSLGIEPIVIEDLSVDSPAFETLKARCEDAFVLVSFPPDGKADQFLAKQLGNARKIVYISSTGVYGSLTGDIDEDSPVDKSAEGSLRRLSAESSWLKSGAIVLRAPGLYSASSGMHLRLLSGKYRLPGDGSGYVSRIHLDDLSEIILAAFLRGNRGSLYLVGDLKPSTHLEVATWLCQALNLPMPESAPLSEVNPSLRGNRRIQARRVLRELGVSLAFPSYIEGYSQCITGLEQSNFVELS